MKPIGGFFELEVPRCSEAIHSGALRVTSGRAALLLALRKIQPRRMHVPFYICDSVLEAIAAAGADVNFFSLTNDFEAETPRSIAPDECLLFVNYFGLQSDAAARIATQYGERAIIDDTHAFFARGYPNAWSFNSARKFFGVPDGAYLYSPDPIAEQLPPNSDVHAEHLLTRLNGQLQEAFTQYQEAERHVSLEPRGMSAMTARLLNGVSFSTVAERRRRNYRALDARLRERNRLHLNALDGDAVPFCYPFAAPEPELQARLWDQSIFVPRLWPEVVTRAVPGFERERELARSLLPLPIDQRYDESDMKRVASAVEAVLG